MITWAPLECLLSELQLKPRQVKLHITVNGSPIFKIAFQLSNFRLIRKKIFKDFTVHEPMRYIGGKGKSFSHLSIKVRIDSRNEHVTFNRLLLGYIINKVRDSTLRRSQIEGETIVFTCHCHHVQSPVRLTLGCGRRTVFCSSFRQLANFTVKR